MQSNDYQDFLRELKLRLSVSEVISHYIPITKKGGRYFCVCPFHSDKNPSMAINDQDGFYHCFACQASGDVIKFVQDYESIDFQEAVKLLAAKANIPVPEFKADPEAGKKKEHSEVLQSIMRDAGVFYRNNLLNEEKGKEAREYLLARGIDDDICKRYGIGLSLDYETLPKYLRYKGYKFQDMKEVGLIANSDNPSDMFANRIIVPIIDSMSKVIAFGGRVYHNEDKEQGAAKYKNSTNTPLFNKSYFVYGINFVKNDRRKTGPIHDLILVEGYMDVISLGAAGITNVVASMGTALTEGQAREIKKIVNTIYVCYDGDDAGRKATMKNIDTLNQVGFDVKVMSLDAGDDPDDTVRNKGAEYFLKKKEEALPIIEYKLMRCEKAFNLKSVDGKAKYVQNAVKILKSVKDDEATLEVYAKIVSSLSGVSIDAIKRSVISGEEIKDTKKTIKPIAPEDEKAKNLRSARFVINRIMLNTPYVDLNNINEDWLLDKTHREIFEYAQNLPKGEEFNVGIMMNTIPLNDEITAILDINLKFGNYENDKEHYAGCLMIIANDYISERMKELSDKLSKVEDKEQKRSLQLEIQLLQKKKFSKNITDKV